MESALMIRTIISKEIFNNLHNLRFSVGMALSVVLTLLCVIILTGQYDREMKDYNARISLQNDFLDHYAHTHRINGMITPQQPPERFGPLITGMPRDTDLGSFDDNPLPALFPNIDFMFIVSVIMSLLALLFSYDALTGEREHGTLRMIAVYPVRRAVILLGKWAGGVLSLMIPLGLSLLVSAIYISLHPGIGWGGTDYGILGLLFLVSIFYISVFYLIGIMVSAFSRSSSASILSALFIWVLLVLVIPNASPYVAAQISPIPPIQKIFREMIRLDGIERDELGRKLSKEVNERYKRTYGPSFGKISGRQEDTRRFIESNPELKKLYQSYRKDIDTAWSEANRIQGEKRRKLDRDLGDKIIRQVMVAGIVSLVSPYVDFIQAATTLTGTGIASQFRFKDARGQYESEFSSYQDKKTEQMKKKDPTFNSNSFIDVSDRPKFSYNEMPFNNRLAIILLFLSIGILTVFNIIFFAAALAKYLRYDVR
jgi:ABC-type transport system involved in multi-copper enzyme maturation permease subunit